MSLAKLNGSSARSSSNMRRIEETFLKLKFVKTSRYPIIVLIKKPQGYITCAKAKVFLVSRYRVKSIWPRLSVQTYLTRLSIDMIY